MNEKVLYSEDPLEVYLRELARIPPLGRAEEIRYIEDARTSNRPAVTARQRLVEANLHLVGSIAERHRNNRVHILELIEDALDRARNRRHHGCGGFHYGIDM